MRWKQNKWRVIVPVLILAVLVLAFWYGGDSKGLHGWSVKETAAPAASTDTPTATPAPTTASAETPAPTPTPAATPAPTQAPAATPAPTPTPTLTPTPTPAATPAPTPTPTEEPSVSAEKHCTISISCASILDHMDWLDPAKTALVPANGWILGSTELTFTEGESVFDVLLRICTEKKIHMEFEETPMYQSAYIEGIYNIYEFDCGELSGWMYSVNGWFPNYGCSRYTLSDGDVIRWVYTCELGDDVGGGYSVG